MDFARGQGLRLGNQIMGIQFQIGNRAAGCAQQVRVAAGIAIKSHNAMGGYALSFSVPTQLSEVAVDRRQAQIRQFLFDGKINILRRRMVEAGAQMFVYRIALSRVPLGYHLLTSLMIMIIIIDNIHYIYVFVKRKYEKMKQFLPKFVDCYKLSRQNCHCIVVLLFKFEFSNNPALRKDV